MPELPEVETVRRGLEPLMSGRRIERVEILDPRLVQPWEPEDVANSLEGGRITGVGRRGKYLLIELAEVDLIALHHLRMTGSFASPDQPVPAHVRLRYTLAGLEGPILYNDPRRFGTLLVGASAQIKEHLDARLGPEPLGDEISASWLHAQLSRRTASLKSVLLNQKVIAGLGNIYVDEACFLAGVRPDQPANLVTQAQATSLLEAIQDRLAEAIRVGGSTLRDYRGVEGEVGGMQEQFYAYGRAGRACLKCGSTMQGDRVAGRGTAWCPKCQPTRRRRRRASSR